MSNTNKTFALDEYGNMMTLEDTIKKLDKKHTLPVIMGYNSNMQAKHWSESSLN